MADKLEIPLLGQIPVIQSICEGGDNGTPVALLDREDGAAFRKLAATVISKLEK
jgi:ATP-binding protein involved in chromosome partitioning